MFDYQLCARLSAESTDPFGAFSWPDDGTFIGVMIGPSNSRGWPSKFVRIVVQKI